MAKVVAPPISPSYANFVPKRIVARVLLAGLAEPTCAVLRDCFKQFGIQTVSSNGDTERRGRKRSSKPAWWSWAERTRRAC